MESNPQRDMGFPLFKDDEVMVPLWNLISSMAEMGIIRVFLEYKAFDAIPADGTPISISDLALKCNAELDILQRFTNVLIAAGILLSPTPGFVKHTKRSLGFQGESLATLTFLHFFDFFLLPMTNWIEYFEQNGFSAPRSPSRVPLGLAYGQPDKNVYEVMASMPERAARFNRTMKIAFEGMPVLGMYNFQWISKSADEESERSVFVDVGGGKGAALKAILEANPQIPASRCVLMDRETVIQEVQQEDDAVLRPARKVAGDFFQEQPVKGALIYYIRRVLNDWSDDKAVQILSHVRAACAPDSKVLVSEELLRTPPTVYNSMIDLFMMNAGGRRRTESKLRELASQADLKVTGVFPDKSGTDTAVIEMGPVQGE